MTSRLCLLLTSDLRCLLPRGTSFFLSLFSVALNSLGVDHRHHHHHFHHISH